MEVNINWKPIICTDCDTCICSTLIEYRQQGSDVWIKPTSPSNPTQEGEYTINIDRGIYYQVKLTFIGPLCNSKSTYISLYQPAADISCCPDDYSLSPDGEYCYQIDDIAATAPSGTPATLVAANASAYSTCGSYIYDLGWNIDGTGVSTKISTTNAFWRNGTGNCSDASTNNGPLNRVGLWVPSPQSDQDVGFGICLELPESKTYYVGIASDNYAIIKLDSEVILQQNPVTVGNQYMVGPAGTFKVWHIYPVQLSAGPHVLELLGHNVAASASLGCEIYNATPEELIASTSYAELGQKLIFSSKDYIGDQVQIGTGNIGYTCPEGYSLASCSDPVVCRKIITQSPIEC